MISESIKSLKIHVGLEGVLLEEKKELWMEMSGDPDDDLSSFAVSFNINQVNNCPTGELSLFLFFINPAWKYPFSMLEYYDFIREFTGAQKPEGLEKYTGNLKFILPSELGLGEYLRKFITNLRLAHRTAFQELTSREKINSLTTRFFDFPEEVRVPCEQYLLYFTEFLRDLGINATSDIKHEAGEILFSVTPANPDQALDKIRIALEAFLSLPRSEIVIDPDPEFEIAMHKVKANVDHLNSQLSLAKAEIRVKERELQAFEATVEAKDIAIEFLREKLNQQKRLLNGEIAEGIIEFDPKPVDDDKEEFFSGIVALRKYEEKGVSVNLAQLYRRLRDFFK